MPQEVMTSETEKNRPCFSCAEGYLQKKPQRDKRCESYIEAPFPPGKTLPLNADPGKASAVEKFVFQEAVKPFYAIM